MKLIKVKCIKISTDGTINYTHTTLRSDKQTIFHEKDSKTFLFSKKVRKTSLIQNLQQNSYKSKYRF